jgi:CRP-like cAMP-binding protein
MNESVQKTLLHFFKQFPLKTYKKNDVFISPDKSPEGVYLLVEGNVRMFSMSKEGSELSINMFKPYSFFPMGWALNVTSNRYYYDAFTDAQIYIAPKESTVQFLKEHDEVVWDLLERIYKGFDGYFMEMESLLDGKAYNKIITQFIIQAKRSDNSVQLTHNQLATLTGLSRETVTREIKKLSDKGLIKREEKHFSIPNIDALEREI